MTTSMTYIFVLAGETFRQLRYLLLCKSLSAKFLAYVKLMITLKIGAHNHIGKNFQEAWRNFCSMKILSYAV